MNKRLSYMIHLKILNLGIYLYKVKVYSSRNSVNIFQKKFLLHILLKTCIRILCLPLFFDTLSSSDAAVKNHLAIFVESYFIRFN